jgi:hypothetical protein
MICDACLGRGLVHFRQCSICSGFGEVRSSDEIRGELRTVPSDESWRVNTLLRELRDALAREERT